MRWICTYSVVCINAVSLKLKGVSRVVSACFIYIKVKVITKTRQKSISGTVFSDGKPRFIRIKGINIDSEISTHMIYTTNKDVPGIIGVLGKTLGDNNINIANFTLGRKSVGGEAIALLSIDAAATDQVVKNLKETLMFKQVQPLSFMVN